MGLMRLLNYDFLQSANANLANSANSKVNTESRQATFQERAEITALVCDVFRDLPKEDIQDAIQIALGDIDDALVCFRDLKAKRDAGDLLPYLSSDPINKRKETKNENS
jgi:hypothetical protein